MALAGAGTWAQDARENPRGRLWLALGLAALAALVVVAAMVSVPHLGERLGLEGPPARRVEPTADAAPPLTLAPLPALTPVTTDPGGSVVDHTRFTSASLGGEGSFFVYLPAGYAASAQRYPVLYMLHGRNGHAEAFLEMGIQASLDGLIARHVIAPMIVVMVQDAPGPHNWRDYGSAPQRHLRRGSPGTRGPHVQDDPRARRPGDRGQLDGRVRVDERGAVLSAAVRGGGELARASSTTCTKNSAPTAR